jgi:beta-glucosidase
MAGMEKIVFPPGFTWGAATAAYQIEGSPLADGAVPSNWHEFTRRRGSVRDGTNGDIACDHYTRYRDDIRQISALGLTAYRFSVGWGRVVPEPGRVNEKGVDFYQRLVDALLEAGIQPWITIFHLEEPVWLSRQGGFERRTAVDRLVDLGSLLFDRLGDRVSRWITVNEPTIYTYCGYLTGEFPPGKKLALRPLFACQHHLLLAHARLCAAWEARGRGGMIGIAHHAVWVDPARPESRRDREAAALMDDLANRSVLDPLLRGTYPERALRRVGRLLPRSLERDLPELRQHGGSYVGINYYARNVYRWSLLTPILHASEYQAPQSRRSAMWEIYPPGLLQTLERLRTEYGNPPCVITENGFPLEETADRPLLDDGPRIDYLSDHVASVGRAIAGGSDCRGYFLWSLLDNFEWNQGLSMRFGLIRTDFATQAREWKKSAYWYRDLVTSNCLQR